ncbi:hypothetical protein [Stenotrophomonas forensis]|uniref:hypothetical protein n=1 Tax=Stenotrophomonas forensis TaxID=2871169 RepID=UPI0039C73440
MLFHLTAGRAWVFWPAKLARTIGPVKMMGRSRMASSFDEGFEKLGEAEVHARLRNGLYREGSKTAQAANTWLLHREHEAQGREAERRQQELAIAGRAAEAAKSSAKAAWASVVIAVIALFVAAGALVVSLVA